MKKHQGKIVSFELENGFNVGQVYEVVQYLGSGSEGEVYKVVETGTGIHRAVKIYFPHCNPNHRATLWYARKLNKLRHCPIVLQYHHTQHLLLEDREVLCLISEFCDGVLVEEWARGQRGKRVTPYLALHFLYHLARGLEAVHAVGEYHADIHSHNLLIRPQGIGFQLKLFDFYNWGRRAKYKQGQDIIDSIKVFHECLGGAAHYTKLPPEVRYICGGLKQSLILKRFPTISALKLHLETFDWTSLH
jgi:hypothetical protein